MEIRLSYDLLNNTYVIARDIKKNKILLGGLGCMGVGQMWFDEEDEHRKYPGYNNSIITEIKT